MSAAEEHQRTMSETAEDEGPACQSCRKRKLRCSREHPTCTHCIRLDLDCVYDAKKNKPGIKAGVIDTLSRRIDALEHSIAQGSSHQSGLSSNCQGHGEETKAIYDILSFFAKEFKRTDSAFRSPQLSASTHSICQDSNVFHSPATSINHPTNAARTPTSEWRGRKRRRLDSCGNPDVPINLLPEDPESLAVDLPGPELMDDIVAAHFAIVQPWIPVLHETRFRRNLADKEAGQKLAVVLHAMIVAALRFVEQSGLTTDEILHRSRRSRNLVILSAMDSLSVENLQALLIIAFVDIGSGHASRAWPIVGSLTRTVEYLQLSIEQGQHEQPLLRPLSSLKRSSSWTEDEERRRVFWTIFNMDRFCSVTTGWNTSLTADDVQRRLPADGGLWHKEKAVQTPYFGIWDKSSAKIGKSIAFMPAHYPSPGQASETDANEATADMSTVGAFAYCVEATESLSRVITYFLQQKVNFRDRQEVGSWLTRFKELDLRLVHWKMFLPQKWRDSNVSREPERVEMDPNLTLAHLTHNASMILLHQRIAYPPPAWNEIVKLPSFCSAETCANAAIETRTITQKYLKFTSPRSVVTSQFAFCVYISARALLVHSKHYQVAESNDFWDLVTSLEEMSRRWNGLLANMTHDPTDLAGKYAQQLRELHQQVAENPALPLDILGYSNEGMHGHSVDSPTIHLARQPSNADSTSNEGPNNAIAYPPSQSYDDLHANSNGGVHELQQRKTSANPPPQAAFGQALPTPMPASQAALLDPGYDDLASISHALLGQQFLEMDRVITYDDGYFATNIINPAVDGWSVPVNYPM